ncbi:MAG: tetratricopeptide repeat protein [Pyrinomonadaceae bacterium]|nr:tetratricopeptide repeat protein [Pyrinomonadaceae bacterium]
MFALSPNFVRAQTPDNVEALKIQAASLIKQQKFTEALPILEKVVINDPNDAESHFYLGFAILGKAANTTEEDARRQLRIRARKAFVKSKELGNREEILEALIQSLSEDGGEAKSSFSANADANKFMEQAEAGFSTGKLDDALKLYQKAFSLDPKIYEAALFSGDVYAQKGDFANAEIWYQKAIAINSNRETAYRYSATPLMKQGKKEQARDRYIEAYIVEPYSSFSSAGLNQWAQATNTPVGHPEIEIPTDVKSDDKGDATATSNPLNLSGDKTDGSNAWSNYALTRANWRDKNFAKTYPNEKTYRHSLAEETEALKSVLTLLDADVKKNKVKTLNPSLALLKKLNDEGLLESYILLAVPDRGIAQDHQAYLQKNRDKLRRYVVQYVMANGGK